MAKTLPGRSHSSKRVGYLLAFIMLALLVPQGLFSQNNTAISIDMKDVPISRILGEIERTTSYRFFYSDALTPMLETRASFTASASDINSAMISILAPANLSYRINGTQVSIIERRGTPFTVTGTVTDTSGEPLIGVSVTLKDRPGVGVATDIDGKFRLDVPDAGQTLVFSLLGMTTQEVPMQSARTVYDVRMSDDNTELQTVMVISDGMFERDKISFTGSVNTVSGDDLRMVGNRNVLQSLKSLDPSFVLVDNLDMGSDPNTMATIEVRGQGSATINSIQDEFSTDPNQPLFVLDGLEVSIETINDLDMNRVESVTILKDAGSTAIYGARGANGVVVIETVKPKMGELRIMYKGDFSIDAPDLSVYNLMNSAEKLEFERLAGKFIATGGGSIAGEYQKALDMLYAQLLTDVQSGVDTYWLSEPLRLGFTNGHSVRVALGNKELSLDLGGKYKSHQGVMKNSNRNTWGGDVNIRYRTDKINIVNYLTVSGYDANDSNYGSFRNWANTSPYYKKYNEEGGISRILHARKGLGSYTQGGTTYSFYPTDVFNPLYDASLTQIRNNNQLYLSDNLQAIYTVNKNLRVNGAVALTRTHQSTTQFLPAEYSDFSETLLHQKGRYENRSTKQTSVRANLDVNYANVFKEMHSLTVHVRGSINQNDNNYVGVVAEGFPYNSKPYPSLAQSYREDSKPDFYLATTRGASLIGSANYNYDRRYLLDVTYSLNGTSVFGTNRVFKPFWSAGIGWNINREKFLKDASWIDMLKIRASTGETGNQNVGKVYSSAIYAMYSESNNYGLGYYLENPGNPNLPWQVSHDIGAGLDFSAWGGRVTLTFDVYRKKTDPLVIFVPQAPSVGLANYPMQMGWLKNTGLDFIASVSPIRDNERRMHLTFRLTGAYNTSVYGGLNSALDVLNEQQVENSTMRKYRNGYSPTDIWAVRSNGIDPATGEEVFITKEGDLTFDYSADDMVVVGNSRPDLMGVFQTIFRYRSFYVNLTFRYSFGSDVYNSALYNKVENLTAESMMNNQDKRALYDRWQKPGDLKPFKGIQIARTTSPQTDRFVQKNNYFHADAITLGYDLNNNPWLKRNLGMENLSFQLVTNDIFRLETSKTERGLDYPFARYYSLTLSATF